MARFPSLAILLLSALLANACRSQGAGGPIEVTGRVVGSDGAPFAEMLVGSPGHADVATDAAGTFSFTGVATPYRLIVTRPSPPGPPQYAEVFDGLQRANPVLRLEPLAGSTTTIKRCATVSGSVTGGSSKPPAGVATAINFRAPDLSAAYGDGLLAWSWSFTDDSRAFSRQICWWNAASVHGTLVALQGDYPYPASPSYAPTYLGYGETPLELADGAAVTGVTLDMSAAVPTNTLSGSTKLPPGLDPQWRQVTALFDDGSELSLLLDQSGYYPPTADYSATLPAVAPSFRVCAYAAFYGSATSSVPTQAQTCKTVSAVAPSGIVQVPMVLSEPATITAPHDNPGLTESSVFRWQSHDDPALYRLQLNRGNGNVHDPVLDQTIVIHTSATAIDLGSFPLSKSRRMGMFLSATAPGSMDGFAAHVPAAPGSEIRATSSQASILLE